MTISLGMRGVLYAMAAVAQQVFNKDLKPIAPANATNSNSKVKILN